MSIKTFHIFFIVISILLAAGCAAWAFAFGAERWFAFTSIGIAAGLVLYGISFVRKSKTIIT